MKGIDTMNTMEFIKTVNSVRLQNKDKWYWWTGTVNGKSVELKAYNTWLQIFRIDGVNYSGQMDISVKQLKQYMEKVLT